MATFVAANAVAYSGYGAVDVALPAGLSVGDSLFACVAVEGGGATVTMPTGWDEVAVSGTPVAVTTNVTLRMYRRQRQAGDADVISVSASAISQGVAIFAFGDLGDVVVWAGDSAGFANAPPSISLTTTGANQWLLYFASIGTQGRTMTAPAGMTQPSAVASGGSSGSSFISIGGAYQGPVAVGTYARQASWDGGSPTGALMIGIAEAGGGGPPDLAGSVASRGEPGRSALAAGNRISASAAGRGAGASNMAAAVPVAASVAGRGQGSASLAAANRISASVASAGSGGGSLTAANRLAASMAGSGSGQMAASAAALMAAAVASAGAGASGIAAAAPITASIQSYADGGQSGITIAAAGTRTATIVSRGGGSSSGAAATVLAAAVSSAGSGGSAAQASVRIAAQLVSRGDGSSALAGIAAISAQVQMLASGRAAMVSQSTIDASLFGRASGFMVMQMLVTVPAVIEIDPSRIFYARLPPSLFPAADPPRRFAAAEPPRHFEARIAMTPHHTVKDPDPTVTAVLTVDFASVLPSGATLTAHAVTASGGSIVNSSTDGTKVLAELSGGTLGDTIEVKFIATPNTGPKRVSTVAVRIATIYAQQPTT